MANRINLSKRNWKVEQLDQNGEGICYIMDLKTFQQLERSRNTKDTVYEIDGTHDYVCIEKFWWGSGKSATKMYRFAKVPVTYCSSGVPKEELRAWFCPCDYVMSL